MKKIILLTLLAITSLTSNAQLAKYQGLFIFNFTRYIEWPAEYQTGNFSIAVLGRNTELAAQLDSLSANRQVGTQPIEIVEFKSIKDIRKCHILFVPQNKMSELATIAAVAAQYNTLIVTEAPVFPEQSAINMVYANKKLKYDVNKTNLQKSGLKISDRLLSISKS